MAYYRCGPTAALGARASWAPASAADLVDPKTLDRPLSGNFDRIFNAFEKTNAFEYVKSTFEGGKEVEERCVGRADVVVNRRPSSSYERAGSALAAQAPAREDDDYYRERILDSQARQLFPLQEDLADWINKTIGITYLTGENFLDALDNGAELCALAGCIHERARDALDQGLFTGPVPAVRGRCWQRAARRSFFSRDNAENFINFCREFGVHENLLFESDDLVLHNRPRQVVLCLLELARRAGALGVDPPALVRLEQEIAREEDSGVDCGAPGDPPASPAWPFREEHRPYTSSSEPPPPQHGEDEDSAVDNCDAASSESGGADSDDVPLRPTNELDKRVLSVSRLVGRGCRCGTRCSRLLKVTKLAEGRYNIAGRNVFIRLLKGRHMMVRVGGGWDTLEHFLSRHEPCQVRLVAPGRGPRALAPPVPVAARPLSLSPASSKTSLTNKSGTVSPVDSKASSVSGKMSPIAPTSGKTSPQNVSRTSTPKLKTSRSGLTLHIKENQTPQALRPRKQSAPSSLSTPYTPVGKRTPLSEHRKSLVSPPTMANVPKKSRSMSLAAVQYEKKPFCVTDRLNQAKSRSTSVSSTPTEPVAPTPRKTRSQSLASTPIANPKKSFSGSEKVNGFAKNMRSLSLAAVPAGGLTQAAIEQSVRALVSGDDSSKKPFLHIKAKYRTPPPREVPPR